MTHWFTSSTTQVPSAGEVVEVCRFHQGIWEWVKVDVGIPEVRLINDSKSPIEEPSGVWGTPYITRPDVIDYALHLHHNNCYEEYTANHNGTYQRSVYTAADRRVWTGAASLALSTITQDLLQHGAWQCIQGGVGSVLTPCITTAAPSPMQCTCDMMLLLSHGCRCGAMTAERAQVCT